MCISCCTNIVQCRAWNKEKGGGSRSHDFRLLLRQHVQISLSRNTGPSASKSSQIKEGMSPSFVQSCKRDLSQNPDEDWEKGIQTFSWRFSSPSPSSLWWLLATYKPSESPKPPATQHFWGQAEKARGKSLERALQCLESAEALASVSRAQLWSKSLKWAYSLQKCGCARSGEGNRTEKRHFIEHCGGHKGASKGKNTYRGPERSLKWFNPTCVSAKSNLCHFSNAVTFLFTLQTSTSFATGPVMERLVERLPEDYMSVSPS